MMTITLWILFTILAILQVADYYSTKRIIDRGGHEEAKIMIWLMDKLGTRKAMAITKGLMCALAAVLIHYLEPPYDLALMFLMLLGILRYTHLAIRNWKIYRRQKNGT